MVIKVNKSAREMFEELGYEKKQKIEIDRIGHKHICFRNKNNKFTTIHFDIDTKEFGKGWDYITIPELKAINQMCKELGWLDE